MSTEDPTATKAPHPHTVGAFVMFRSWSLDFPQSRRNPVTGTQDGAELPTPGPQTHAPNVPHSAAGQPWALRAEWKGPGSSCDSWGPGYRGFESLTVHNAGTVTQSAAAVVATPAARGSAQACPHGQNGRQRLPRNSGWHALLSARRPIQSRPGAVATPTLRERASSTLPAQLPSSPARCEVRPRDAVERKGQPMPAEKFYPSTAIEGEPSDHLEIRWGAENPGVHAILEVDGTGALITLDRSGINRLIRSLRRARDATYGADE